MSSYQHCYRESDFVLRHLIDFDGLCVENDFEGVDLDLANSLIDEAARFGAEVLAPLNVVGDREGARMGEGGVVETPGFAAAYRQFAEGGWQSLKVDERHGGQGLPDVLNAAVSEIWHAANLSLALCPMLTEGAIEALAEHGDESLCARYLPRLSSGEWTGTMNLTEPDAGSDLAAIKTRAVPEGDAYRISGQKIFITWGDHRMTDNIVHLVLARLPDAPPGVKGISLFVVPKYRLDAHGEPAEANGVRCLSLEHKLGIHGSPTCVMAFDDAWGELVGEPHRGLAYMFTMMNRERQVVGLQGLAIAERAYQQARLYAMERLQGTRRDGTRVAIVAHPDVRRMLMTMKSGIEAMRALVLETAAEADRARGANEGARRAHHQARLELFTPIVKGWITEFAQELTSLAIQVHGGMGFVEETGVAQHYRDARILTIYEGTTGIQALDLVSRKLLADEGRALGVLFDEMEETLGVLRQTEDASLLVLVAPFADGLAAARRACDWVLCEAPDDRRLAGAVSVELLMLLGYLCGGWMQVRSALAAQRAIEDGEGDALFLDAKLKTARFYCEHVLARTQAALTSVLAGSTSLMALDAEQF
ncbi:acyl-CoA dehydrogenase [Marichromatium gracile]|nr:acyl-CoA dehydrogenase [Marichromatium gracile]